jgi:TetR/AcrR family transcriptional regulator, cholesterol catabolism regulator
MQTSDFHDIKAAILKKAESLFMRFGLKSISMDDVTRELGISKKTLYQYFESKEALVMRIIRQHQQEEAEAISEIKQSAGDAIAEMLSIARHVIRRYQHMSPSTLYDLKKYYPEAWKLVEHVQREFIYKEVKDNLDRGIAEGLYRTDFDVDILARLYVGSSTLLLDEQQFPGTDYHWEALYREFIYYHLRGIASEQGRVRLQQYQEEL